MAAANEKVSGNPSTLKEDISINKWQLAKGGAFLASVTGMSVIFGFGLTIGMAKKKDPAMFTKGLNRAAELHQSGAELAMKALGWGTIYSITGFSAFCWIIWKALGVHNLKEFREKMQSIMPIIPKKEPQGRSDFKSVRELVNFIIEESEKEKNDKKSR